MYGVTELRTSTAAPHLPWDKPRPVRDGRSMCAQPFTDVPGTDSAAYLGGPAWGNIPDDVWAPVSQTVIGIAARHGFTEVIRLVDKPGHHVMEIYDSYGSHVSLATRLGTSLTLYGGCFLNEPAPPTARRVGLALPPSAAGSPSAWSFPDSVAAG
jgi:hypothetical protein